MNTKQVKYSIHTVIPRGGKIENGVKKSVRLLVPAKVEEAFAENPKGLNDLVTTAVDALKAGYAKFRDLKAKTFILTNSGETDIVTLEKVYTGKNRMAGTHYADASDTRKAGETLVQQLKLYAGRYGNGKPYKSLLVSTEKPQQLAQANEIAGVINSSPGLFVRYPKKHGWIGAPKLEFSDIEGTNYAEIVLNHRASTPFAVAKIHDGVTQEATDNFAKSIKLAQFDEVVPFN